MVTEPDPFQVPDLEPIVELCKVSNELEANLVVTMLKEHDIIAMTDATDATPIFGGLPFEAGHRVYVYQKYFEKSRHILEHYPNFKPKAEGHST